VVAVSLGAETVFRIILKRKQTNVSCRAPKRLNQYGKTTATVLGHTDSVGSDASNQVLSESRAQSVMNHFAGQNVNPLRLESYGRGETEPRADNSTEAGRQLNRRVELWILPVVAS